MNNVDLQRSHSMFPRIKTHSFPKKKSFIHRYWYKKQNLVRKFKSIFKQWKAFVFLVSHIVNYCFSWILKNDMIRCLILSSISYISEILLSLKFFNKSIRKMKGVEHFSYVNAFFCLWNRDRRRSKVHKGVKKWNFMQLKHVKSYKRDSKKFHLQQCFIGFTGYPM